MNAEGRAFAALVRPHIHAMYRMAYRWTRNREDAEDLVQEVLIKAAVRFDEIRRLDSPRAWLLKVLYRHFVDLYRRRQRSPMFSEHQLAGETRPAEAATGDSADALALQETLELALASLDPDQRETVMMHDVEGYTAVEIAEVMAVSVGTVKSRLHRARERLRNFIGTGTF